MTGSATPRALSPAEIAARKGAGEPLVCLTAYTAPVAGLLGVRSPGPARGSRPVLHGSAAVRRMLQSASTA